MIKRTQLILIISLIGSLNFSSCKPEEETPQDTNTPITPSDNVDVYVVGSDENFTGTMVAKYWKNGLVTDLSDGTVPTYSRAIYVSSGNVLVGGYEFIEVANEYVNRIKVWKNDVEYAFPLDTVYGVSIPDGNTTMSKSISEQVTAVTAADGHDYVLVYRQVTITEFGSTISDNTYVKYYKDDEEVQLGEGGAASIFVAGNDVYVAGRKNGHAVYWKNGVEVFLSNGIYDNATGIVAVDNDVYVSGFTHDGAHTIAKYWVNGVETVLSAGTYGSEAQDIEVVDGDVYAAGLEYTVSGQNKSVAKNWKNGVETILTDGTTKAKGQSIAVVGNDVYVSGIEEIILGATDYIKYWKNGIEVVLSAGSDVTGGNTTIVVVPF
jgi:hypothetical protein